ncbi:hypothetical protein BDV96DRAFT_692257 [Lophiotrema nucula]|uniref:Uncharacterized protein n=1 Tax=Lophiotrema nucula TaxID=690887 RepID=A0A6A5YRN5_9PLEO|nr:hypothetical protein BDV96DRAFT_692257 [Lophiotrema nucula]
MRLYKKLTMRKLVHNLEAVLFLDLSSRFHLLTPSKISGAFRPVHVSDQIGQERIDFNSRANYNSGNRAHNSSNLVVLLNKLKVPKRVMPISDAADEAKKLENLKINPKRRIPAIQDAYTGLTLWELWSYHRVPY